MKIISIVNEKGGVTKTTTTYNLASALTKLNKRVLVVDLDQQANLSYYAGHTEGKTKFTISELIYFKVSNIPYSPADFISTNEENIDYIPSSKVLSNMTAIMSSTKDSQMILKNIFTDEYFVKTYDYILFDCRPSLDLLTTNALVSSNGFIIPAKTDKFSLDAIYSVFDTLSNVKPLNPNLEIYGILVSCFEKHTIIARDFLKLLQDIFDGLVFETIIPKRNEAILSSLNQKSLDGELGKLYLDLALEVIRKALVEGSNLNEKLI